MERLLKDAEKLSGVKYDISNLSDVYNAIHVIQENLGITGTTAKEAMYTIEGSSRMAKSAWDNVVLAIGRGEGVSDAFDNFLTAVFGDGSEGSGLINNIVPRVKTTMEGIANFIVNAAPIIADAIPGIIDAVFPSLFETAIALVGMLVSSLPSILESLGSAAVTAVHSILAQVSETILGYDMFSDLSSFMDAIMDILGTFIPNFVENGVNWLISLFSGFTDNGIIGENLNLLLESILIGISEGLPQIMDKGIELVTFLVNGMLENLPTLITTMGDMLVQLLDFIMTNMPLFLEKGIEFVGNMANGLMNNLPAIIQAIIGVIENVITTIETNMPQFLEKGKELIEKVIGGIGEKLPEFLKTMAELLVQAITTIAEHLPQFLAKGGELIGQLIAGIIEMIPEVVSGTWDIINSIFDAFADVDWLELGSQVVNGLIDGLASGASAIWDAATNAASNAFDAACDFLGIESPSKLGRYIGRMFDTGIAEDIEDNAPVREAENMVKSVYDSARSAVKDIEIPITTVGGDPRQGMTVDSMIRSLYELVAQYLPGLSNQQVYLYPDKRSYVADIANDMNEALGEIAEWEAVV